MLYRKLGKTGVNVSELGYGCMRFPSNGGKVDEKKTEEQIMFAIQNGVNYFDTAYIYHAGKSEEVLGKILSDNKCRETVYIADKLPPYLVKTNEDIEKVFNTQLERLKTDYIDFYLMHALSSLGGWERLKEFGIIEFIKAKKEEGKIRHIGFSFHGKIAEFKKIIDDYEWDFCQIQFNYLDEHNQAGLEGLEYAKEKGLGVVIMEPLRGGSLAAKAPDKVKEIFNKSLPKRSAAEWALRFVWNHEEVSVVLSGMNVDEHIKENIRISSETASNSMSKDELEVINKVKNTYKDLMKVPCTGCGYCMPCPYGVDIPYAFNSYNSKYFFNNKHIKYQYNSFTGGVSGGKTSYAWLCKECGRCEKHCPQGIQIRKELKTVTREFRSRLMDAVLWIFKKIYKIK